MTNKISSAFIYALQNFATSTLKQSLHDVDSGMTCSTNMHCHLLYDFLSTSKHFSTSTVGDMFSMNFFTAAATAYSNARFGQGTGPILMDNVACTGLETGLVNCTFDNHTSDCRHSEDAGVQCSSPPTTGECEI